MDGKNKKFFSIEDLSEKNSQKGTSETIKHMNKMFIDISDFARGSSVNIFRGISIYSSPDEKNVVAPTIVLNGKDAFIAMGYVSERPEQVASYEAVLCQFSSDDYSILMNLPNTSLPEAFEIMNDVCKEAEKVCFSQTIIIETETSIAIYVKREEGSEEFAAKRKDFATKCNEIVK